MENLNAEQIKKALEWCYAEAPCSECPYQKICFEISQWQIMKDALDLINSQEQRIKELAEENERLHASCTELTQCCTKLETLYKIESKRVDTVKADTVRKMQERIKQYIDVGHYRSPTEICFSELDVANIIDRIAKEMLEGDNEG